MASERKKSGPSDEQEAAFLAPKIPLEKKCVQHSFFTAQTIGTFCNQEPLSVPWRASIQYQVRFQRFFFETALVRQTIIVKEAGLNLDLKT